MREHARRLIFPSAFAELRAVAGAMTHWPTIRRAVETTLHRGPSTAEEVARGFRVAATDPANSRERCLVLREVADLLDEWAEDERPGNRETPDLEAAELFFRQHGYRLAGWQVEALEAIFEHANEPLPSDRAA